MYSAGDVRFFDHFAPVYDLVMPPADSSALETVLGRADRDVERIVSIGGGSGWATLTLDVPERIVPDRSAGTLRRACGRGLDCARGDARKLSFADDSLDAVAVVGAFHHMPNQRSIVEGVFHVLAPGGVFAVNEFDLETLLGWGLVAAERVAGFGPAFAMLDELVRLLERVGSEAAVVEHGFEYTAVEKKREGH